jgi:rhomboid protease GluP
MLPPEGHEAPAGPRRPAPAAMRAPRPPIVTWSLLIALGGVFALEVLWGDASSRTLLAMGANVPALTRAREVERFLAATTLHVTPAHAVMNLYVLWALGGGLERLFGRTRFVVLYFLSGLGGAIGTTLFGGPGGSAGASGAIWGLLVAAAVLAFRRIPGMPPAQVAAARRSAVTNLLLNVGISFLPGIDRWAHFGGGLAGGLLVGLGILVPPALVRARGETEDPLHERSLQAVAVFLVLATLASVSVAWWRGQPWLLASAPLG